LTRVTDSSTFSRKAQCNVLLEKGCFRAILHSHHYIVAIR